MENTNIARQLINQPEAVYCPLCETKKPRSEFYTRSGNPHLILAGCKVCRAREGRTKRSLGYKIGALEIAVPSEAWAISRMAEYGIPALPGKALVHSHTDVVAWGCVQVEVKSSLANNAGRFNFGFTPKQVSERILGDVIVLICNYGVRKTFHVFEPDEEFFFISQGRRKSGVCFMPEQNAPIRHFTRKILTQTKMDAAEDRWSLISDVLAKKCEALRNGA